MSNIHGFVSEGRPENKNLYGKWSWNDFKQIGDTTGFIESRCDLPCVGCPVIAWLAPCSQWWGPTTSISLMPSCNWGYCVPFQSGFWPEISGGSASPKRCFSYLAAVIQTTMGINMGTHGFFITICLRNLSLRMRSALQQVSEVCHKCRSLQTRSLDKIFLQRFVWQVLLQALWTQRDKSKVDAQINGSISLLALDKSLRSITSLLCGDIPILARPNLHCCENPLSFAHVSWFSTKIWAHYLIANF